MHAKVVVLLVAAEAELRRAIRFQLRSHGYRCITVATRALGEHELRQRAPDVVVAALPADEALELVRDVRASGNVPVVVIGEASPRVEIAALDGGADDFVPTAAGVDVLLARLRALLRRAAYLQGSAASAVQVGDVHVDMQARRVVRRDEHVRLTPLEYKLLVRLVREGGRPVPPGELLADVWGPAHRGREHYLRVYVGRLRRKLEDDPADPRFILTEPGFGYRVMVT